MKIIPVAGFAIDQDVEVAINSANGFLLLGTSGAGRIRELSNKLNENEIREYNELLDEIRPEIKNWYNRVYSKHSWQKTYAQLVCLRLLCSKKGTRMNEYRRGTAILQKEWKKGNKKKIIHAIAMSYDLLKNKSKRKKSSKYLLKKALISAFEIAKKNKIETISVPIMVARENYGLNPKNSEHIILNILNKYDFQKVFLCYDSKTTRDYLEKTK
ncbi:MAG: hypothetical protein ABIB71_02700 [Candidatus Woesearchaeota archaeon]